VLIATFYVSLFPIDGKPNAQVFFESYLAAPLVLACVVFPFFPSYEPFLTNYSNTTNFIRFHLRYTVSFFLFWWAWKRDSIVKLKDIDIDVGRREFPSLEQLRAERAEIAEKQFFSRWLAILC
jgi:yeast amino acid transporter